MSNLTCVLFVLVGLFSDGFRPLKKNQCKIVFIKQIGNLIKKIGLIFCVYIIKCWTGVFLYKQLLRTTPSELLVR